LLTVGYQYVNSSLLAATESHHVTIVDPYQFVHIRAVWSWSVCYDAGFYCTVMYIIRFCSPLRVVNGFVQSERMDKSKWVKFVEFSCIYFVYATTNFYFDLFFIDIFKNKTKKTWTKQRIAYNSTMYFLLPDLETKFNYHILVLIMNLVFPVLIDLYRLICLFIAHQVAECLEFLYYVCNKYILYVYYSHQYSMR
jgi:hypothetical protein